MVNYDVMVDEQGNYVRMSLEEIIASGRETVRIRSMRGKYFEIRVETLRQTDREEIIRRRNAQLARERRERREDPDYDPRTGEYHPLPQIIHHDELPPLEEMLPRRNPRRPIDNYHRFQEGLRRGDDSFEFSIEPPRLIPRIPDEELTVPEPQLRNEEAENWRKQANDYREKLEMATEEIHELQEMLKSQQRKMVLGMIEIMKLTKQTQK